MNKRTTIFVVIISLLIVASVGGTVWYLQRGEQFPSSGEPQPPTNEDTNYFPSSGKINGNTTKNESSDFINQNDQTIDDYETRIPGSIKKMTSVSVAGITFVNKNEGEPSLRFIEKGTGHIKDMSFSENIPTKITNTTITGIVDTSWGKNGQNLILRRLEGINNILQTIYGTIEPSSETEVTVESGVGKLNGTILPSNTLGFAVSPDKDKVFYLINNGGSVVGTIGEFNSDPLSSPKTQIWSSPLKEWSVSWESDKIISLATKPSSSALGQLYSLSVNGTNNFQKVIGDISGLTTKISPKNNNVIYSETVGTGFMTYFFNQVDGATNSFPLKTLPEKCVFSKGDENIIYCGVPNVVLGSKYPESWYQGISSFSDTIWQIDTSSATARIIIDKEKLGGVEIDIIEPILSENEDFFAFINKKDGTAWVVKLK